VKVRTAVESVLLAPKQSLSGDVCWNRHNTFQLGCVENWMFSVGDSLPSFIPLWRAYFSKRTITFN